MSGVHLHLLLSHVPIVGVAIGLLLLLSATVFRSKHLRAASLVLFVLMAAVTAATFASGEPAEDAVEHLAGVSKQNVERHEDSAKIAAAATYALGAVSLIGLLVSCKFPRTARWATALVLLLAFAATGLLAWTANRGGEIRHTEISLSASTSRVAHDHD